MNRSNQNLSVSRSDLANNNSISGRSTQIALESSRSPTSTRVNVLTSKVRFVHNVAHGADVTLIIDGKEVIHKISYKGVTNYLSLSSEKHEIIAYQIGTRNMVLHSVLSDLKPGFNYTAILHGNISKGQYPNKLLILEDGENQEICEDTCSNPVSLIRFIHAAEGVPAVNLIIGKNVLLEDIHYGRWEVDELKPGSTFLTLSLSENNVRVLGPIPYTFKNGHDYTILASGLPNDATAPVSAIIIDDTECPCINIQVGKPIVNNVQPSNLQQLSTSANKLSNQAINTINTQSNNLLNTLSNNPLNTRY